jgi:interferon gamma-inducible protein 30
VDIVQEHGYNWYVEAFYLLLKLSGNYSKNIMQANILCLVLLTLFGVSKCRLVNVTLYGEALCPFTAGFVVGPLKQAVQEIGSIFTFTYSPWGNARMVSQDKFSCQHGRMECTLNTVEACVIHYYPKRDKFFPFLVCAFQKYQSLNIKVARSCAEETKIAWQKIDSCYTGNLGHQLEKMYAVETSRLKPAQQYVPWVTINGKVGASCHIFYDTYLHVHTYVYLRTCITFLSFKKHCKH